ncbi:UdgX family uracil-DNA binding protein [Duganella sp. FT135W]|uniref:Type-4 uracil-DNA glycosylase n=1 Tax=Duganella flavida TaxID=2692175 RepID=A0A6L8KEX2_9BURK|nr:UdgX family uracil-DNA binding protein [Duganella flavida]MYM24758.1 UdgX family uracil-DNA binding protein [Duganella flavida]
MSGGVGGAGVPVLAQSFAQWRDAARTLLARGVAPESVQWIAAPDGGDLFAGADSVADRVADSAADAGPTNAVAIRLPRELVELLECAACCRVPDRWALLYQVVWRWHGGDRAVLSPADRDGARLHAMAKAVRREQHDMHAYVRFRERDAAAGAPRFVAWFEPSHDVLPQVAQHFARRMGKVSWMIATPGLAALWDGSALQIAPSALRGPSDIDDAGEALWLTYYRSIFNPARLNAGLMRSHIPSRFWKHLPEGAVVPQMVSAAALGARRTGQTETVGQRDGAIIAIAAERAQPQRAAPVALDQCRRCPLWQQATQAVPGVGPAQAAIMLVGEQPGDQEDLAGVPFIGPAGALLDRALAEAEVARLSVYLTNAVKHFKWEPRGKRRLHKTPAQREVAACHAWLEQELARVQPRVIVALGGTALKSLLQDGAATVTDKLGVPFQHEGRWIIPVYHPSYALRAMDAASRADAYAVIVDGLRQARALAGSDTKPA